MYRILLDLLKHSILNRIWHFYYKAQKTSLLMGFFFFFYNYFSFLELRCQLSLAVSVWLPPHRFWLIASNAHSTQAQVIITFQNCPSVLPSFKQHFSSLLPNSPTSQLPSVSKPYLLVLPQVDRMGTTHLSISSALL